MSQTIGIVEDDQTLLMLLTFKMKNAGYNVKTYEDGFAATEKKLLETPHDLIILDIVLPGKSGYELLIALKENPKTKDIPVIVLTARTLEKDLIKSFNFGATDFIRKPFSPGELLKRVQVRIEENKPKQSNESNTSKKSAKTSKKND